MRKTVLLVEAARHVWKLTVVEAFASNEYRLREVAGKCRIGCINLMK